MQAMKRPPEVSLSVVLLLVQYPACTSSQLPSFQACPQMQHHSCLKSICSQPLRDRITYGINCASAQLLQASTYTSPHMFLSQPLHSHKLQMCSSAGQNDAVDGLWGIPPFFVARGPQPTPPNAAPFDFRAPTTASNALRVMRALQLKKAVLLEGSPGVGKTSLVAALATAIGQCRCPVICHHAWSAATLTPMSPHSLTALLLQWQQPLSIGSARGVWCIQLCVRLTVAAKCLLISIAGA